MKKHKVAVIGTINRDSLIFPNGKRQASFGGLLYSLSALSALGGKRMEIYPVCNLGYDVYPHVMGILGQFDNVKPAGIRKVNRRNNHVVLNIDENNERQEVLRNRVPVLSFSQVRPFLDCDAILVNFTSGFDVGLETLQRIRQSTDRLVFLDVHSLSLGVRKNGRRYLRVPRSWKNYVRQADVVQCNVAELRLLSGRQIRFTEELREFGRRILDLGPKTLLVTMGEKGAVMLQKQGRGVRLASRSGIRVLGFKDATGCGDVFSAGFLSRYLATGVWSQSLDFANRVAAEKCKVSGVEDVFKLLRRFSTSLT
jgi:sugar/nucleoside kinase (ribokinase family)